MNDNLSCGLVRDLLPSYLEGLTSEETNEALREHFKSCEKCAGALKAMGWEPQKEEPGPEREVDYLRKVKRRNRKRVLVSVLATAAGLLAAFLLKVFVIGTPLQAQNLVVLNAQKEYDRLRLELTSVASANAYHGWRVETVDGIACIYARDVLVSGLFHDGGATIYVPLEGVEEVWLGGTTSAGRLVWQDGMVISQRAAELAELRTPYCGDPTVLGDIARVLLIRELLGDFTVSMDTSRPPYRWTLEFERNPGGDRERWQAEMKRCACVMLALVENLDEVAWTWPDGTGLLFRDTAGQIGRAHV